MKLDILVIAAHPDDAELGCAGTLASHVAQGKKVGIVDMTEGELGTRGTPEIRLKEAHEAARILGIATRENLGFADGYFENDRRHQLPIITAIRKFQPDILITNAQHDRHPDHPRAAELVERSSFLSGLAKVKTALDDIEQKAWRPKAIYHFIQSSYVVPDFIVDVSDYWDKKINAIQAFKSQFHDPANDEPETFISNPDFLVMLESRARDLGHSLGIKYGEGFTTTGNLGIKSFDDLV